MGSVGVTRRVKAYLIFFVLSIVLQYKPTFVICSTMSKCSLKTVCRRGRKVTFDEMLRSLEMVMYVISDPFSYQLFKTLGQNV